MSVLDKLKKTRHNLSTLIGEINRPSFKLEYPNLSWSIVVGGLTCARIALDQIIIKVKRIDRSKNEK